MTDLAHGDPTMHGFWEAARRHELVAQHCGSCDAWQLYARPFCLACLSDDVSWRPTSASGTIYSRTIVRRQIVPHLEPPYTVGIVELDEGPRLLTNFVGGECHIGARVKLRWREREDSLPPMPIFEQVSS
jgi:uncharacterized OB-fold protein